MKIVQVMPEFGLAGAEVMCESLSYELKNNGNEIVIVSLYDFHTAITDRIEKNGIKIIYLNKKPGLDLRMISRLVRVFKQERPDVIHTHRYVMQYAIPAAVLAGIKNRVHTVHNIATMEVGKYAQKLSFLFYHINKVTPVALSKEVQQTIIERYHLDEDKVPVIFNGIDLSKCIPKENYSSNKEFTILHIGRFSEQKNHIEMIKGFQRFNTMYPDSKLVLIGDGVLFDNVVNYVNEIGLQDKIEFLGLQSSVYSFLNNADVFLLPSLYEGVPITLIEAMGTGLPIIASAVGGVPDMLSNSDALLISPTQEDVCNALCKLVNDLLLREKLGKNAIFRSNVFSSKEMALSYLSVYSRNKQ